MPKIVAEVHVVCNADEAAQLQLVHAGFFLNLPHGADLNVFSGFLMALGEVPEAVSGNEQKVSAAVTYQAPGGVHFLEFCTDSPIASLNVRGGNVNAGQGVLHLKHAHQSAHVHLLSHVEFHGVRVCQCFLFRGTYYDASLLEVDFVHGFCYICNAQS